MIYLQRLLVLLVYRGQESTGRHLAVVFEGIAELRKHTGEHGLRALVHVRASAGAPERILTHYVLAVVPLDVKLKYGFREGPWGVWTGSTRCELK